MIQRLTILLAVMASAVGCSREPEPPQGIQLEAQAESGVPRVPVDSTTFDETYTRAANVEENTGAPSASSGAADRGPIEIDDSTPEATINSYIELWNKGDFEQALTLYVPEQRELYQPLTDANVRLFEQVERTGERIRERFPDDDVSELAIVNGMASAIAGEVVSVTELSETESEAVTRHIGSGQEEMHLIRRTGDSWRIADDKSLEEIRNTVSDALADTQKALQRMAGINRFLDENPDITFEEFLGLLQPASPPA